MPHDRSVERRPEPKGAEAWLPQLLLAVAMLAVVVALVRFVVVARPLQGRIALPAWTIPAAVLFCGGLALYLAVRAVLLIRGSVRALRRGRGGPCPP